MPETQDLIIRLTLSTADAVDRLISAIENLNLAVNRLLDSEHAEDPKVADALEDIARASEAIDVQLEKPDEN